jgi:hypothetical protein
VAAGAAFGAPRAIAAAIIFGWVRLWLIKGRRRAMGTRLIKRHHAIHEVTQWRSVGSANIWL